MRYGSVCSGIEAATVAWHPLGWEPAFFSEIEAFPRAVLQHHYKETPLHGDFTTIGASDYGTIDLLVGGTPCQSFSIAGLRKGMDDDRGNLALEFLKLAHRKRPTWVVWENVPGVLSSNGGRDFGAFLGGLGELGYGWAYRVLDAQYFGVAQRRRRVFVVGYLGNWTYPAAVLFERHSLQGHPAPSREKGKGSSGNAAKSTGAGEWPAKIASTMNARFADKMGYEDQHALGGASYFVPACNGTLTTRMMNALGSRDVEEGAVVAMAFSPYNQDQSNDISITLSARSDMDNASCVAFGWQNSASQGDSVTPTLDKSKTPAVAISTANTGANGRGISDELAYTRDTAQGQAVALPINTQIATRGEKMGRGTGFGIGDDGDPGFTLQAGHSHAVAQTYLAQQMAVRRLTPTECERLQGFPDGYTAIPWRGKDTDTCPDGPRYKALGNSMAVPVMRWIGERIKAVDKLEVAQ